MRRHIWLGCRRKSARPLSTHISHSRPTSAPIHSSWSSYPSYSGVVLPVWVAGTFSFWDWKRKSKSVTDSGRLQISTHLSIRRLLERLPQRPTVSSSPSVSTTPANHHVRFCGPGIWFPIDTFDQRCLGCGLCFGPAGFARFNSQHAGHRLTPSCHLYLCRVHCIGSTVLRNAWNAGLHCWLCYGCRHRPHTISLRACL